MRIGASTTASSGRRSGRSSGFVSCGTEGLLYYDYATNQLKQTKGVATLHRVNGLALWCVSVAIAVIGLASIVYVLLPRLTTDNPLLGAAMVPWILLIAVISGVFIGMVKKTVEAILESSVPRALEAGARGVHEGATSPRTTRSKGRPDALLIGDEGGVGGSVL